MQDVELFERWKALVGDTSPRRWDQDYAAPLLHHFRPSGDGVDDVFVGVAGGDVRESVERPDWGKVIRAQFAKMAQIPKECGNGRL